MGEKSRGNFPIGMCLPTCQCPNCRKKWANRRKEISDEMFQESRHWGYCQKHDKPYMYLCLTCFMAPHLKGH